MDSRQEFEEHTRSMVGYEEDALRVYPDGSYREPFVSAAWQGWQAARKPKHTREDIEEILVQKIAEASFDLVIDALIEAGILTVKGADANDD